jgi:ABC-type Mn2+/Zn2+ transport system permease subunit
MTSLLRFVTDPLELGFFVRGLIAAVFVMLGGALLGFGVLTRRSAFLGQGVSQSMLAGVALGAVFGIGSTLSAFAGAVLAAILIGSLSRVRGIGQEGAIAVVASAALSLGVAVVSADRTRSVNLTNLLFGNVLGVAWADIVMLAVAVGAAAVFSLGNGRRLALAAMTPQVAQAHGVDVRRLELARMTTLALVTAAAVQVVGVTLVVAALVLPAAMAAVTARTLGAAHSIAVGWGTVTAVLGLYVSYYFDLASGPAVVLTGTALYLLTLWIGRLTRR